MNTCPRTLAQEVNPSGEDGDSPKGGGRADDDADVVKLEALAGVDAPDLVYGRRTHDPKAAILREVPLPGKIVGGENNVHRRRIPLARPIPAIVRHQPRASARRPFALPDPSVELLRRGGDGERIILHRRVGRFSDAQELVDKGELAFGAVAAEFGREVAGVG